MKVFLMFESSSAKKLLDSYTSREILEALKEKGPKRRLKFERVKDKEERELSELFRRATQEMKGYPDLIISVNELKVRRDHDWGSGEIYVISHVLDKTGLTEYKSPLFQGIKDGQFLPLGEGGMFAHYKKDPKYFIDIHGVVMESDSDIKDLGDRIQKAKEKANLDEIINMGKSLTAFDPTKMTMIMNGVNCFLDMLIYILQENKDDHVGTFHDFYLKEQQFGVGRHPKTGLRPYQDIELAYTISFTGQQA